MYDPAVSGPFREDLTPAAGGGIVPHGPSAPDSRRRLIGARVVLALTRLPRPVMDRLLRAMPRLPRPSEEVARGVPVAEEVTGGVPTTWLAPDQRSDGVIVFLHGGSYSAGPDRGQWAWLAEIQRRSGIAAAMVRYRMPPEHPFPAALDDAVAAIRAMAAAGQLGDGSWILGGDSAGGGLALATAHALRDAHGPLPAGLVLTAPWVDLEMEQPGVVDPPRKDLQVGRSILRFAAERYADGVPLDDPRLSPVNGSMDGLPPVHLNVGMIDLFLPDIRRLRDDLEAAGVAVTYIEQEGGGHTYPQQVTTPEAEWTIRSQVRWIQQRLGATIA